LRVVWSAPALRDLGAIRAYLCSFNPVAARRIARKLRFAGGGLALFPARGRTGFTPGNA
jgi:plasmid stabilization system protein ParE